MESCGANAKTFQPRCVVRFDLNHLMKHGLGFDEESTKQSVYGR
jgi:hypothetical protein